MDAPLCPMLALRAPKGLPDPKHMAAEALGVVLGTHRACGISEIKQLRLSVVLCGQPRWFPPQVQLCPHGELQGLHLGHR